MTDPFEEARENGRRFREQLGTPRVYDVDSDGQLAPVQPDPLDRPAMASWPPCSRTPWTDQRWGDHTPDDPFPTVEGPRRVPNDLFAACTPNSLPDAEGRVEHGFQINVMNDAMAILTTIDLPDWETFRPASAGHRLIEHGYMIHPDARGVPQSVNGWRRVGPGFMVPVIPKEKKL